MTQRFQSRARVVLPSVRLYLIDRSHVSDALPQLLETMRVELFELRGAGAEPEYVREFRKTGKLVAKIHRYVFENDGSIILTEGQITRLNQKFTSPAQIVTPASKLKPLTSREARLLATKKKVSEPLREMIELDKDIAVSTRELFSRLIQEPLALEAAQALIPKLAGRELEMALDIEGRAATAVNRFGDADKSSQLEAIRTDLARRWEGLDRMVAARTLLIERLLALKTYDSLDPTWSDLCASSPTGADRSMLVFPGQKTITREIRDAADLLGKKVDWSPEARARNRTRAIIGR